MRHGIKKVPISFMGTFPKLLTSKRDYRKSHPVAGWFGRAVLTRRC
jgi:hypothetical protein